MRIQHNIAALNAHRQLGNNNSAVSKNLEKLSSGYRINRAGDDAAGLAISEKMRAQIKGLETASKNAQDGVSLIQTAEGALTEVHSMLNRMVELATQSANGTYGTEERTKINNEVNALKDEIDRISEGTNFNGINLLDGSMGSGGTGFEAALTGGNTPKLTFKGAEGMTLTIADGKAAANTSATIAGKDITLTLGTLTAGKISASDINKALKDAGIDATVELDKDLTFGAASTVTLAKTESKKASNAKITVGGIDFESTKAGNVTSKIQVVLGADATTTEGVTKNAAGDVVLTLKGATTYTKEDITKMLAEADVDIKATNVGTLAAGASTALKDGTGIGGGGLELQVGDTNDSFQKVSVSVDSMSASSLGLDGVSTLTQDAAGDSLSIIKSAIEKVSTARGDLGALQNRLDHTINNLGVTTENMTAAESRIRDVDMAQEMMTYTKNNILTQASQAMLAQANQLPQGVLQLLQ